MLNQLAKVMSRVQRHIDKPWYPLLVALLAALDLFIMIVPTDGLMVSAVMFRPKKWVSIFIVVSLGSALGALTLAGLLQSNPDFIVQNVLLKAVNADDWKRVTEIVQDYGAWGLAFISLSPFPMPPAVLVLALAPVPILEIFLVVLLGRLLKYGLFAWVASHAPRFLYRFRSIRKEVADLGVAPVSAEVEKEKGASGVSSESP